MTTESEPPAGLSHRPDVLEPDAGFPWQGELAYAVLNARLVRAGHEPLGPSSTMRAIQDALFLLQADGQPTRSEMAAWHTLRVAQRRFPIDFYFYPLARFAASELAAAALERPLPVAELDMLRLVEHAASPAARNEAPDRIEVEDMDWAHLVRCGSDRPIDGPLLAIAPTLAELEGGEHA